MTKKVTRKGKVTKRKGITCSAKTVNTENRASFSDYLILLF